MRVGNHSLAQLPSQWAELRPQRAFVFSVFSTIQGKILVEPLGANASRQYNS